MARACLFLVLVLFLLPSNGQNLVTTVFASTKAYFTDIYGTSVWYRCSDGTSGQSPCSTSPPVQVRWGEVITTTEPSGLGFTPNPNITISVFSQNDTIESVASSDFFLGTLVHYNWPVNRAATGVQLNINLTLTSGLGNTLTRTIFGFRFAIDETDNQTPCPYQVGNVPCADRILFLNSGLDFSKNIRVGQTSFTLQLLGFKETSYSRSNPSTSFISAEERVSTSYLFGRLQVACPSVCVGGGSFVANATGKCSCDCSGLGPCPKGQIRKADCSCGCPQTDKHSKRTQSVCNGNPLNEDCTCDCPSCRAPFVSDGNCNCQCPSNFCGCGVISESHYSRARTDHCYCNCTQCVSCPGANMILGPSCNCTCKYTDNLCRTLNSKFVEDPSAACGCVCNNSSRNACARKPGYVLNELDCTCDMCQPNMCPNGQTLFSNNCTCGDCAGNWNKNVTTGLCTECPLRPYDCTGSSVFDPSTCKCVCESLSCDNFAGFVVDQSQFCGCRNCTAGECVCGNGRIEPGEQCEPDSENDPCCVNCQLTTSPCDDGNGCTTGDTCSAGVCIGFEKCEKSTDCRNVTCDPLVGVCVNENFPENSFCGVEQDLCNSRCVSGTCQTSPVTCVDPDATDCVFPTCDSKTGQCSVINNSPSNQTCSDGNSCTFSDTCQNGTCLGSPVPCPTYSNPCKVSTCQPEFGMCQDVNVDDIGCDADGDACTANDFCSLGTCIPGKKKECENNDVCTEHKCDRLTAQCVPFFRDNITCSDNNTCTENDICFAGNCFGNVTENSMKLPECGYYVPPTPPGSVPYLVIGLTVGAAGLGAFVGAAFLFHKVQAAKLMDPVTWNPEAFSSVGTNPLYKGAVTSVESPIYQPME